MKDNAKHQRDHYERRRAWLNKQKGTMCSRCKNEYPSYVLEFHHRDRATKMFVIGTNVARKTIAALIAEIAKCDVLCANCHRIVEYEPS